MKKNIINKETLVYIVILLLGIILILGGWILEDVWESVCISIGTSILSSALIYMILNSFIGDPLLPIIKKLQNIEINLRESIQLLEETKKVGLTGIWTHRSQLDINKWISKIETSNNNIDILGYAIAFLPEHYKFMSLIEEKAKNGCKVRILLGEPHSYYVIERNKEEKNEGSISSRIETSLCRLKPLIDKKLVEVRLQDTPLYCSIYRFDDDMLITPQLYGIRGSNAPLLNIKNIENGLFCNYVKHFDDIWNISKDYESYYNNIESNSA